MLEKRWIPAGKAVSEKTSLVFKSTEGVIIFDAIRASLAENIARLSSAEYELIDTDDVFCL